MTWHYLARYLTLHKYKWLATLFAIRASYFPISQSRSFSRLFNHRVIARRETWYEIYTYISIARVFESAPLQPSIFAIICNRCVAVRFSKDPRGRDGRHNENFTRTRVRLSSVFKNARQRDVKKSRFLFLCIFNTCMYKKAKNREEKEKDVECTVSVSSSSAAFKLLLSRPRETRVPRRVPVKRKGGERGAVGGESTRSKRLLKNASGLIGNFSHGSFATKSA